ncbi:hypothetical protein BDF20DRAFT_18563 [Mycotypha africana]|uniref:uncharacterized protein n=1 Tax=Mycotypha africana TaxID=64632 RepID=UPI002300CA83|nr:uncharacterized protein BDF20DRAFT_18563 [Mycotypha africana]KAI8991044.1 hypothetical protein BDF20DRAFT_18563 [Mycotypha africana]
MTPFQRHQMLNPAYGCYIWPSALVMAEFVWFFKSEFENKVLLEVGAGTSLPSLLLAKASILKRAILSDTQSTLPVIQGCVDLNTLEIPVHIQALNWGTFGTAEDSIDTFVQNTVEAKWNTKIDYIIGSDTFYEPSQFENLLTLVSYVIHQHNPQCKFITAYQERSPKRSIQYLLDKWHLKCKLIPKESFDFDEIKYTHPEDSLSKVKVNAGSLSSVFVLEISR